MAAQHGTSKSISNISPYIQQNWSSTISSCCLHFFCIFQFISENIVVVFNKINQRNPKLCQLLPIFCIFHRHLNTKCLLFNGKFHIFWCWNFSSKGIKETQFKDVSYISDTVHFPWARAYKMFCSRLAICRMNLKRRDVHTTQ